MASWEPKPPLEIDWFEAKSLMDLLQICHNYWNLNWNEMSFVQKYYFLGKQVFVRKCLEAKILPTKALQFVYCVTKGFDRDPGTLIQEIIDCQIMELFDDNARNWNNIET